MTVVRTALGARKLISDNPALALLRQQNAPVAVAILGEHLAGERRELPASDLFEAVEADLTELRDMGQFDLPQTAVQYVRTWLSAGFLIRRTGVAREELYALSEGALSAIRFVQDLASPRTTVTESRLSTIVERVHRLTVDTDPDTTRRIEALRAEREKIDAQIARLQAGEDDTIPEDKAAEQAADALSLAAELPEDFARLRTELEEINRRLRAQLIEDPESRGTVLDDIFAGVDVLAQSEAGKSFSAFYSLVLDPERTAALEDDVDQLLSRPFARRLTPGQRYSLRRLLPAMQDSSAEIHQVMTSLSRSLRRFVQSEELAEDRRVNDLIRQALTEANAVFAAGTPPFRKMKTQLNLTSVPVTNFTGMRLHNPADSASAEEVQTVEAPEADLAALQQQVREAEIDREELVANVNAVLGEYGASTIGEVLRHYPATQGAASVVGLLVLAEEQATRTEAGRTETVTWEPVNLTDNDDAAALGAEAGATATSREASGVSPPPGPTLLRAGTIPLYLFERTVV